MLSEDQILSMVLEAVSNLNQELGAAEQITVTPTTQMFGADAELDSLQLVSVIVDVETALASELGRALSLTDDQAIGEAESPYRNPTTLSRYIAVRLQSGH